MTASQGRRAKLPALAPEDRFGPWKVLRTGLRTGQTPKFPHGHRAARIQCSCGKTRTEREARLPVLAKAGDECRHGAARGAAAPRNPARKTAPADTALPAGWHKVTDPKRPPRKRSPRTRPAEPPVPDAEIRPGLVISGWEITATGLTRTGEHVIKVTCTTCGHKRTPRRAVFAARLMRPCPHAPEDPRRSKPTPGQLAVLAWMREHAPGRAVSVTAIAAGTGHTKPAVTGYLRALTCRGTVISLAPGSYALPGVTAASPAADPGPDRIRAFLAADGGGTFSEILDATGLTSSEAASYLETLTRRGQITRTKDTGRWFFYLLTGQEPGQSVDLAAAS